MSSTTEGGCGEGQITCGGGPALSPGSEGGLRPERPPLLRGDFIFPLEGTEENMQRLAHLFCPAKIPQPRAGTDS